MTVESGFFRGPIAAATQKRGPGASQGCETHGFHPRRRTERQLLPVLRRNVARYCLGRAFFSRNPVTAGLLRSIQPEVDTQ